MKRVATGFLGLTLLSAAVAAEEPAAHTSGSGLEALGRSLGGWRVVAVNALFLRAESLRRAGRTAELPALHQALVDLDPDNDAAIDALVGEQVGNLLPTAPTLAARRAWWRAAWDLTEHGLGTNPASARLMFRAADLLLELPERRPELAPGIDEDFGGRAARETLGLGWLLASARATEHLPKFGRLHLLRLARAAPELSVRALQRGQPPAQAAALLSAGEELLRLHPDVLRLIREDTHVPVGQPPRQVPLDQVLRASVAAVRAALAASPGEPTAPLEAALAAYVEVAGETPLATALRSRLPAR